MEAKNVQVKILTGNIIAEGSGPCYVWVTASRARLLVDSAAVELVTKMPKEQTEAGPTETKPTEATETKKPLDEPKGGPLIASQASTDAIQAPQSSASAVVPASQPNKSNKSSKRTSKKK